MSNKEVHINDKYPYGGLWKNEKKQPTDNARTTELNYLLVEKKKSNYDFRNKRKKFMEKVRTIASKTESSQEGDKIAEMAKNIEIPEDTVRKLNSYGIDPSKSTRPSQQTGTKSATGKQQNGDIIDKLKDAGIDITDLTAYDIINIKNKLKIEEKEI